MLRQPSEKTEANKECYFYVKLPRVVRFSIRVFGDTVQDPQTFIGPSLPDLQTNQDGTLIENSQRANGAS